MIKKILPAALAILAAMSAHAGNTANEFKTFGTVGIRSSDPEGDARYDAAFARAKADYTAASRAGGANVRLLKFYKGDVGVAGFGGLVYDYNAEKGYTVEYDLTGREVLRTPVEGQPLLGVGEFDDAARLVAADPRFAAAIAAGDLMIDKPMPPVTTAADGARAVNVSLHHPDIVAGQGDSFMVGVVLKRNEIFKYDGGAPPTALSGARGSCGTPSGGSCSGGSTSSSTYDVQWPAVNPVWKFTVIPPVPSTPNPNGSGIELRNVRYKDHLVAVRMHTPVLDVKYDGDSCGPYRDWMDSESCFSATGTNVSSGIRVCTQSPATFCESGSDSGNFRGVAIWDEGPDLWLATELDAGWYRYIMQWRFYADGRIQPIFGFGATSNGCVCFVHHHHVYWRFDMAPDGTLVGDTVTGATQVTRKLGNAAEETITTEQFSDRPASNIGGDVYRITNPNTGFGYRVEPSKSDGSAVGDTFGKHDNWVLAYHSNELSDGRSLGSGGDQSINIDSWDNNESLTTGRVAFWYRAGWLHDIATGDTEPCEMVGPTLYVIEPTPTASPSPSPSPSASPSPSPSSSPSPSPSAPPSPSPSQPPTPSASNSPSPSATPEPTPSDPPTATAEPSPTATVSPTNSATPSQTPGPVHDSDGDGFDDDKESQSGSDPNDPASMPSFGDFDANGKTGLDDAIHMGHAGPMPYDAAFDVNRDGVVDDCDAAILYLWSIGQEPYTIIPMDPKLDPCPTVQ